MLFIDYNEYLYYCNKLSDKCERAISVGETYSWEEFSPEKELK